MKKFLSLILAAILMLSVVPGFTFAEDVTGSDMEITATHYYGDANFDETINTADAAIILKISAGMLTITEEQKALTNEGIMKIDANKNGQLNTADASFLLKCAADMEKPNEYYEYSSQPTTQPTAQPTAEPTAQPTEDPNPDAYITINCYDTFNEIQVAGTQMGVKNGMVVNAENIVLPESDLCIYKLENPNFSAVINVQDGVATPSSLSVNVYPVAYDDGEREYKVIFNTTGFDKINNDLAGYYTLGADLDLQQKLRKPFGWNWQDPTQDDKSFTGIFDGRGFLIDNINLTWNNTYDFSHSDQDQTWDTYSNIGLFAINSGVIRNLYAHGTVIGDMSVGMIAGANAGVILNCHAYGSMASYDVRPELIDEDGDGYGDGNGGGIGGICGDNYNTVKRCSYEGFLSGLFYVGGLVGVHHSNANITESYFAGYINNSWDQSILTSWNAMAVGGIAGISQGNISDCYVYCANTFKTGSYAGSMFGMLAGGNIYNVFVINMTLEVAGWAIGIDDYNGLFGAADENLDFYEAGLSETFSTELWDMNGASHSTFPDLVNNRRDKTGFYIDN